MSTNFSKGIFDSLISTLNKYKQELRGLGYSHSQIQKLVLTKIFQLGLQELSSPQNDSELLFFSLKQSMAKFTTINQALISFLVNLELQITLINEGQDLIGLNQQNMQNGLTEVRSFEENRDRNVKKSEAQEKTGKQSKVKKRCKKQKRGIKEIQKQAQIELSLQEQQMGESLKQIELLKQILHKKILNDYFKADILESQVFFMLPT